MDIIHNDRSADIPPRILLYGPEGIGKSTVAAQAPGVIFIPTEDGLDQIDCDMFPLSQTYSDFEKYLGQLVSETHQYQTVAIDSLDWLERLIWRHICKQYGVDSIEKVEKGFGKGYAFAMTYWHKIVEGLRILREQKKMNILLIAHNKVEDFSDPETTFKRFSPRLHKHAIALLCEWCDCVLLATRELGAQRGDRGGERIVRTSGSSSCVAKNRYGLPDTLPMKWDVIYKAIKNCSKPKKEKI